jgi:hypothetical protein
MAAVKPAPIAATPAKPVAATPKPATVKGGFVPPPMSDPGF